MAKKESSELRKVRGKALLLKARGRNSEYLVGYKIETKDPDTGQMAQVDYLGGEVLKEGDQVEAILSNMSEPVLIYIAEAAQPNQELREVFEAASLIKPGVVKK